MTGDDPDNSAQFLSGKLSLSMELAPPGARREAQIQAIRRDLRSLRLQLSEVPGSTVVFPDGRVAVEVDRGALSRQERLFLAHLRVVRYLERMELRDAGLFEALRRMDGKIVPGAMEAGAYALFNVRRPGAARSLLREIHQLRAEGDRLVFTSFYDKLERISRFRPGRFLKSEDSERMDDARKTAQERFQPLDLRPATLEDMHQSQLKRGRPALEDPWVASFPRVYHEFGRKPTDDQLHHAAVTQMGAGGTRPTKRQVRRAWRTVECIVMGILEPRWDGFMFAVREKMAESKPDESGHGSTLEENLRECILATALLGLRETDAKRAAALDILLYRHRRDISDPAFF